MNAHAVLTLLSVRGIGRKTVRRLLALSPSDRSSPDEFLSLFETAMAQGVRVRPPSIAEIEDAYQQAGRDMQTAESQGIQLIGIGSSRFPGQLALIPDAPVLIYVRGFPSALVEENSVAIIGTRHPTPLGARVAGRTAERFAQAGFVVVSGLAEGCDAQAHIGCLKVGGRTVAVLAHGLDRVYPRKNTALAEEIVENNGCLISEYPLGTEPQKGFFVERDRLQSGLSKAVIVVETDLTGGTMHTVGYCQEQGRVLVCFSHPADKICAKEARGNQKLLSEGTARPLANEEDFRQLVALLKQKADHGQLSPEHRMKKQPYAHRIFKPEELPHFRSGG